MRHVHMCFNDCRRVNKRRRTSIHNIVSTPVEMRMYGTSVVGPYTRPATRQNDLHACILLGQVLAVCARRLIRIIKKKIIIIITLNQHVFQKKTICEELLPYKQVCSVRIFFHYKCMFVICRAYKNVYTFYKTDRNIDFAIVEIRKVFKTQTWSWVQKKKKMFWVAFDLKS